MPKKEITEPEAEKINLLSPKLWYEILWGSYEYGQTFGEPIFGNNVRDFIHRIRESGRSSRE